MHGLITPDEADLKLLNGIFKLKHPFLPLFVAVFEAKRYFENVFDLTYTSSLYFTKERGTSLMYAMAKTSIYDRMNSHDIEVRQGKRLETDWEKLLYDIWSGYCYAQALPEVVQLVRFISSVFTLSTQNLQRCIRIRKANSTVPI